ncbi:MAG TPA: A24 family peptidase [Caproiciproducens sp.]|nr:A24 family peptidase [Caproiciproducens sp.]
MKTVWVIVPALFGLVSGFFIPLAAREIMLAKYREKYESLVLKKVFTWLPVLCCLLNAAGWAAISYYSQNVFSASALCLIWSLAILISVIDVQIHTIPNETVLLLMVLGIDFQLSCFGLNGLLFAALSMAAVMAGFLFLAGAMGFQSVGAGDVKLAGAMGLALGYPHILYGLIAMSVLMIAYSLTGMLLKKITLKSMLPFAPFMMAGMAVAVILLLVPTLY